MEKEGSIYTMKFIPKDRRAKWLVWYQAILEYRAAFKLRIAILTDIAYEEALVLPFLTRIQ